MTRWIGWRWLVALIAVGLALGLAAIAANNTQITISNVLIGTPNDGKVKITWITSQPARVDVYFGQQSDNLDKHLGNIEYKVSHQADLTGLKKKTDYYYKIIAVDESGQRAESFVQYFNTKDMKDTVAPTVGGLKVIQTIDTAAAIYFLTDEPSRIELNYGTSESQLDRRWSDYNLRYDHLIILSGLLSGTKYYFRVLAKDEDNNITERTEDFTTDAYHNYDQIKISNLVPESLNQAPLLPERAAISWDSNILATSEINYGTEPTKLSQSIRVSTVSQLSHRAELINLKPNTTYYFKIKMSSSLNNKSFESQVYSLKTAALSPDYLKQFFQSGNILSYHGSYYYLYNNYSIKLNNNSLAGRGYQKAAVKPIEDKYFSQYKEGLPYWGSYHDGQIVKQPGRSAVYLIDGQYKRPIANMAVFRYLNYKVSDIIVDQDSQLRSYREGPLIRDSREITNKCPVKNYTLAKSPGSGAIYLIANNRKMPFANQQIFLRYGFKFSNVKTIEWGILGHIVDGQAII